jgi:cell division protein FtsL
VLGLLALVRGVSRHRLLDRLIRGRTWIALVAFALLGIVTLQLTLLKLNASIGRSLERSALLQRENAALSIENSEMAEGNRVESTAARLGMELVPAGALKFLVASPRADIAHAAAALSTAAHATTAASSSEAPGAGAAETSGSSEPAASTEAVTSSATSSASAEQAAAGSTSAAAPAEAPASAPGESSGSRAESGASAPSEESPASSAAPGSTAGASAEATPAGGTQAGPAG